MGRRGRRIPVKAGTVSSKRLNRYKLAAITTLTEELNAPATPSVTIRDMMFAGHGQRARRVSARRIARSRASVPLAFATAQRPRRHGGRRAGHSAGQRQSMWAAMVAAGAGAKCADRASASLINLSMIRRARAVRVPAGRARNNLLGLGSCLDERTSGDSDPSSTPRAASAIDHPGRRLRQATSDGQRGWRGPTQAMDAAGALERSSKCRARPRHPRVGSRRRSCGRSGPVALPDVGPRHSQRPASRLGFDAKRCELRARQDRDHLVICQASDFAVAMPPTHARLPPRVGVWSSHALSHPDDDRGVVLQWRPNRRRAGEPHVRWLGVLTGAFIATSRV